MRSPSLAALMLLAGCATAKDPRIQAASGEYEEYGKVDDLARWAPTLCRQPDPPRLRLSASRDLETHGRKLYFLFAKDREAYRLASKKDQPTGQVLVKESWIPAPESTPEKPLAGEKGPLFLMMKTGEADSDAGWIYATATPDGKTITASGKIASCMECHTAARSDRLFGVISARHCLTKASGSSGRSSRA
jgi:hypothetical protein